MITVEVKLRIAVLVPQELQHIITKQNDPMFIACREDGHIIIKPMEEYGIREISVGTETDYRKGYMAGVTDGYEDGYHRGFQDCTRQQEYDPRYQGKSWLASYNYKNGPNCTGHCHDCDFYDDIFCVCRFGP